mgnify:CR=1 FL=1
MGEEDIAIDETNTVDEGVDETALETPNSEGTNDGTDAPSQEGDKPKTEEKSAEDNSDKEPPVRKKRTNEDWVKLRQQRKAERDAKKAEPKESDEQDNEDDDKYGSTIHE